MDKALKSQIRECFGRVVYTHKAHEKDADILRKRLRCLKTVQIILSALTTAGIVVAFLALLGGAEAKVIAAVTALVSGVQLFLTTYSRELDLGGLSEAHSESAKKLWDVREIYLSLITDIQSQSVGPDEARAKRDELQERLSIIYENAPRTSSKAYKQAQKALKVDEELTFTNEEIDQFVPSPLRLTE